MAICGALGVARSHLHSLMRRAPSWRDGRSQRTTAADEQLLAELAP